MVSHKPNYPTPPCFGNNGQLSRRVQTFAITEDKPVCLLKPISQQRRRCRWTANEFEVAAAAAEGRLSHDCQHLSSPHCCCCCPKTQFLCVGRCYARVITVWTEAVRKCTAAAALSGDLSRFTTSYFLFLLWGAPLPWLIN